jgi:hypothetical protein
VITAGAAGAWTGLSSSVLAAGAGCPAWPSACMSGAGAFWPPSSLLPLGLDPPACTPFGSSPSSASTAIGVLTATLSVPSATRILASTPSSTASTSMVALSVSISARMSPALTGSPSFLSHFASLPCSIVGERAGIRMSVAMGDSVDPGVGRAGSGAGQGQGRPRSRGRPGASEQRV